MKKMILAGVFALLASTAAFAHDPIGPVNTAAAMSNPEPDASALANHRLYVQNLKDAGLLDNKTNPIGPVDTIAAMFPNHSKVPLGQHYVGARYGQRDPSANY